jgi:hypothetical protein
MAGGFKIADAYVEIQTKSDAAEKDVDNFDKKLRGVDDKIVKIGASDQATPIITDVDQRKIKDKETTIEADDQASAKIDKVDSIKPEDKNIKVDADTGKAESKIKNVGDSARPVVIPADADTGPASAALQGLGDLGAGVGDKFSGGMVGALSGGVAGAVASIGMMIVDGIAEKISESRAIERALTLQFSGMEAEISKFTDMFDTNMLEDINHALGMGQSDQTIQALNDMGIETEQLAATALQASKAFSEFGRMGVADQRALTTEIAKTAAGAGIDVPAALKGAGAAARTWGMTGWDATRLVSKGFTELDSRGDDWAETLQEYSPHFKRLGLDGDTSLRLIRAGLEHGARDTDKMGDSFKELGLRVVDGTALTRDAMADLGLDAEKTMAAFGKGGPQAKAAMDAVIDKLNAIQDPVERNRLGVALMGTQWEDTAKDVLGFLDVMPGTTQALNASGMQTQLASEKARGLSEAFLELRGPFESAAKTAGLVSDALDRMNGKTPSLRDTTQAWNDLLREFGTQVDWDSAAKGVQRLNDSLVDARGEINTTTEAGSKLEDWAGRSKDAFMGAAGAMREAGIPASEMTTKLQVMRDEFIRNAESQGLPKAAAERLATAYGLVPTQVSTAIYAPGLLDRMTELGMLGNRIVTLPDGRFTVTGDDNPARNTITKLVTDFNGKTITLNITAAGTARETIRNAAGGRPLMRDGGPVIGPGNGTSDDVPLMGSNGEWMIRERVASKNRAFLEWFNKHGDTQPIQGFAGGGLIGGGSASYLDQSQGVSGPININIYPPATMDYGLIAAKVSRELELQRQGSG